MHLEMEAVPTNLIAKLTELLDSNSVGVTFLIPLPGGGRLTSEAHGKIQAVLDRLSSGGNGGRGPIALAYGNGCFAIARYADAASVYLRILEREPNNLAARFNLGLSYARMGRLRESVAQFTAVIEGGTVGEPPRQAEAYYQRGNVRDELGECELALGDYAQALDLRPDYIQAFYNKGVVLARVGRHRDAIAEFDRVISRRPTLSNAYLNRGASLDELGEHDQAIADYTAAIRHNPANSAALFNRARTFQYLGYHEDAVDDYSRVIEISPGDAEAFNNRGLAFDALDDCQRAVADYLRALALNPEFAEVLNNLGAAYESLAEEGQALEKYLAALHADPDYADAHYNAARMYLVAGDIDRCVHHLEKALEIEPPLWAEAALDDDLAWVLKLGRLRSQPRDNP